MKILHKTIRKATEDIEGLRFNTAISQFMIFVNHFTKTGRRPRACLQPFVQLLCPFAPHMAEELWQKLVRRHRFVMTLNGHQYLEQYHAAFLGGGVVNPLNLRFAPRELAYVLRDSGTKVCFVDAIFAPLIDAVRNDAGLEHVVLIGQGDVPWIVLGDPEGNAFCVMEERSAYAGTGTPLGAARRLGRRSERPHAGRGRVGALARRVPHGQPRGRSPVRMSA